MTEKPSGEDVRNNQAITPRPEVLSAPSVPHGALDYGELENLGLAPKEVLDFSVNGNPYGPPPGVRAALQDVPLDRYPDRDALALRRALSKHLAVPPRRVMAGNGTAELIWLIALGFVRPADPVLILGPTFGEYERAVALMGAQVETWRARPESEFVIHANEVDRRLQESTPRLVFLCNPNNPTGAAVSRNLIRAWADAYPDTLFIVDEAYLSFATELRSTTTLEMRNVVTLRSMTKDYALAALRLGYLVADEAVIDALVRVRPPWNVNAMAQAAGLAALEEKAYLERCMARLRDAKKSLVSGMKTLELEPLSSTTHFFLVQVGDAAAYRRALLAQRVQVRDCSSFGLPSYVRIATRRPRENARLLKALQEVTV